MITTAILYSVCIFTAALLGGIAPLLCRGLKEEHFQLLVGLGAGLLMGMAFLHMLPESAHRVPDSFGAWFMLGFCAILILERFAMVHACEETHCDYHTIGMAAFAGLTIHGLIEGFAVASALLVADGAFLILAAILAHKIPAGMALTSILSLANRSRKQIFLFVCGVALSGPIGIMAALLLFSETDLSTASGALIALSAGTFVYIGACDLLPELHRQPTYRRVKIALFVAGVLLAYWAESLHVGHHH